IESVTFHVPCPGESTRSKNAQKLACQVADGTATFHVKMKGSKSKIPHIGICVRVSSKNQDTKSLERELASWAKSREKEVSWYTDKQTGTVIVMLAEILARNDPEMSSGIRSCRSAHGAQQRRSPVPFTPLPPPAGGPGPRPDPAR